VIVDRSLYRELAKDGIKTGVEDLREKAAAVEAERKQARRRANHTPADPLDEAQREQSRQLRELAERAHGVNLDLGASLLNAWPRWTRHRWTSLSGAAERASSTSLRLPGAADARRYL
jgi:hypothetical protein